ncbi:MAG: cohesin domain-containing protein [Patescibacteria group bacterium]
MEEIHKNIKSLLVGTLLCAVFSILPIVAQAATLYFSPSSGSHAVGTTFSISVYVSSADQAMNAASGAISFPSDKLEVASLSKIGSIFSLWVQEPTFSNTLGTVNFEGIVLNPGFTGSSGKIISITFKTKTAGNAPLTFSSGSVLAHDGKGTNTLTDLGDANFSIGVVGPATPEIVPLVQEAGTPPAPEIRSPTHPDPNRWYAVKDAKFTWDLPKDATAVRLLVGKIPQALPTVTYTTPMNSKEITDLDDGTWYFHVQVRNAKGWGGVSHFRLQIDTEKPAHFDIREIPREDFTEPKVPFVFDARDKTSGIDYYEIKIDGKSTDTWKDDGSHTYTTPTLNPGKHILIAKVVDKAGNSLVNSAEFIIQALTPPEIMEYPRMLRSGDVLFVKGKTAYLAGKVNGWLQKENEEAKSAAIEIDDKGRFILTPNEKLKEGIYKLWAEAVDERGAKSEPGEKITVVVERPALLRIGSQAVELLAIVTPLVALIILLGALLWYGWHKFAALRKQLKKEVRGAESALHEAFDLLKEDIREQMKMLEKTKTKRELTQEEEKVMKHFRKHLDDAEKFVRKEIQDIEKGVKQ